MDDDLLFSDSADSNDELLESSLSVWKILIVDDEPEVHQITKLALANVKYEGIGLRFLHAYSAAEALPIIKSNTDIALVLLDVVMETNHAGLELVQRIREELGNTTIRIVLRTGQPGEAPERDIIANYDINDYSEKADLSAQKLFTLVIASLRAYRDLLILDDSRKELILAIKLLQEQGERIQVTLDSIGDAVLTTDENGNVTHLNPVAEALTGWLIKDAIGQPLKDIFKIINAHSRLSVDNPVEKVLTTGRVIGLANHTVLIAKDGTEFQIADSAAPIRNAKNEILGVVLVFRDVTQEYLTEEALRRSQKMEAIGQLTGGIAHDFNNQLGVIAGYLHILQKNINVDKETEDLFDVCNNATSRCIDLTRQLLSFSRKQSTKKVVMDVNQSLQELTTMFERSVTPAIDVQYELSNDLWLTEINVGEFQDAALNLVINSRDAMPDGGKLIIKTTNECLDESGVEIDRQGKEYIKILFGDTGMGMDQVTQDKIFEPFYTTKPDGHGTGLGMSMVYGFVKRFDGFIKISSEVNKGTDISLYFPRTYDLEESQNGSESEIDLQTGSETILIVDDEKSLLNLAKTYLNDLGYKTYLANNAEEALSVYSEHPEIDCLFTDVVMPGDMNGYQLAAELTQRNSNLKVLLTSGYTSNSIIEDEHIHFNENLLNKPYDRENLASAIRLVLD